MHGSDHTEHNRKKWHLKAILASAKPLSRPNLFSCVDSINKIAVNRLARRIERNKGNTQWGGLGY